jgi:cellobiose phosphorylase
MVGCVEGILGIRPDFNGLKLSPSVPKEWKSFTMKKSFRGKKLNITVENPEGKESGFTKLYVNGKEFSENYISEKMLSEENEIKLVM